MSDTLLVRSAEDLLTDVCDDAVRLTAERDGWAAQLWSAVAAMGLPWISVPEAAGGQGGDIADAFAVLRVAGRHALPLPLAETGLLGGWLLAAAGLPLPTGPLTVVPPHQAGGVTWDGTRLHGTAHRVPWARAAERILTLVEGPDGTTVVVLDPATVRIEHRTNVAFEPRDSVHADGVEPAAFATVDLDRDALAVRGALSRVALMAGALERVLELTVRYTNEREQFGRPVARFQAVQQHLVTIAQQSATATMAADVAIREYARGDGFFEVAAAKVVADDATRLATRAAHQAHGAMGATQEYPLHFFTRRLWSWTREYGGGTRWARRIGALAIERGADQLYPLIAGGSAARTD